MPTDFSKLSYWQLVWMQFRKKKMAMTGLYVIGVLFLVAVYCPLFIGNRPYYLRIGNQQLLVYDLLDPASLIGKFRAAKTPLDRYLHEQLSAKTHQLLRQYQTSTTPSPTLQKALVYDLNKVLAKSDFYDAKRFQFIFLSADTRNAIKQQADGLEFNRRLLEEAYPKEIAKYYSMQYPWLLSLFDINYYEGIIDIIFNLLMVISPFFIALYFFNRRLTNYHVKYLLLACMIIFVTVLTIVLSNSYSQPYIYYGEKVAAAEKAHRVPVNYIFPPIPYSFKQIDSTETHPQPPNARHWWGTDRLGRDVLARMVFGLRIAFSVGVVAVSIYVTIGIILGALAGYFRGIVDLIISRLIEIMLCFPILFFILTVAAVIEERSIFHIMLIIGVLSWPRVARLTRAEFLKQREMDYVQGAVSQGIRRYKIVFSHILPNSIAPVLVSATFGIAWAILYESTLSFLGVGDNKVASWGELLNMGRQQPQAWWLIMIPGFSIFLMVALFNLVGDGLRDSLDPKLRE